MFIILAVQFTEILLPFRPLFWRLGLIKPVHTISVTALANTRTLPVHVGIGLCKFMPVRAMGDGSPPDPVGCHAKVSPTPMNIGINCHIEIWPQCIEIELLSFRETVRIAFL
jgi:hypothetical protein